MDTSSRTKSVERPVRAVDLFIASLDALTLLEGSSTLSVQIDSDERSNVAGLFRLAGLQNERRTEKSSRRKKRKKERCSIE